MKHKVSLVKLANGAEGLLIHIPSATVVTFDFDFRAGEYLVNKPKWETPHLMEHMLLGANERFPKARTFQAEFEKNGAYNNASTGSYNITYEAECADFEWQRVMKLMTLAITKPLFHREEFEAEFGNVREELTARSNNHFRHLSLKLRQKYGFAVLTDQERLKLMTNVSPTDIKQHYHYTHTASNLRFVIAGRLPKNRRDLIEKRLSNIDLPGGEGRIPLPDEEPKLLDSPVLINNKTVKNIYFYIDTFAKRRLDEPELDGLGLINSMLTETLYSRILGTAREQGLVYSMSSNVSQTKSSTNWWFGAQVRIDNASALFKIMATELNKVFEGQLTKKDIAAAKQYALGRYQRSGQTVSGTASGYAQRYFFDETIDDYYKIPARIKNINKQAIVSSAQTMFADKVWGMGVLGNADQTLSNKLYKQIKPLWR